MADNILALKDKNGVVLYDDCVIFGSVPGETENEYYWNLGFSPNDGSFEMIACEYGYVHNVQPTHLVNCIYVGPVSENLHVFNCD